MRFGRQPSRASAPSVSRQLHQRRGSARRVDAAVDPRVAVIADDDDVVRLLACRGCMPVTVQIGRTRSSARTRMCTTSGTAADAIGERQSAAPLGGASGPPSDSRITRASLHESGALTIAGQRDARRRRSIRRAPGSRRPAGRQRIARHEEVVDDAAALDVAVGSPRAVRIHVALARTHRLRDPSRSGCRRRRAAARSAP